jgi:hypothetical protein
MNDHLESLKAACRARGMLSESERIREGESLWFAGVEIPAEAGHVGLSMGERHSVIVSESSILEVEKEKDTELYFVRVKAGATALVRSEAVMTVSRQHCDCSRAPARTSEQEAGESGGSSGSGGLAGLCDVTCQIGQICAQYTDRAGYVREICVPIIQCSSPCQSA